MIVFDFITQDELDDLPEDFNLAFMTFVRHAQRRLNEYTSAVGDDNQGSWQLIEEARHGFMNVVIAAAKRYDVKPFSDLEVPRFDRFKDNDHRQFKADLDHYMTQILLDNSIRGRRESVLIDDKSKNQIRSYIYALKECIDAADLTDSKRAALLKKLAEFESLLDKKRLNLLHVTLVAMEILALPGGIWASNEIAHKLVSNVLLTVAQAKAAEDETRRLPPVAAPAALSPPRRQETPPDLDDEIPF